MRKYVQKIKIAFIMSTLGMMAFIAAGSYFAHIILAQHRKSNPVLSHDAPHNQDVRAQEAASLAMREHYYQYYLQKSKAEQPISFHETLNEGKARSVPVLLYHGVLEKEDESTNVSIDAFYDQMASLHRNGWHTVSLSDYFDFMEGKRDLPERSFLLTFDDGRRDSYLPVDPLLELLQYRAVMFMITNYGGKHDSSYYLTVSELDEMKRSGRWELQAHAHDAHNPVVIDAKGAQGNFLSNLIYLPEGRGETIAEYRERVTDDLLNASAWVAREAGETPLAFAFPYGDYGQRESNLPDAKTLLTQFTSSIFPIGFFQVDNYGRARFNTPQQGFLHGRITVHKAWLGDDLAEMLEAGRDRELPLTSHDALAEHKRWMPQWGNLLFETRSITLGASTTTQGAAIVYGGGERWKNYEFTATVDLLAGESFSLLARYDSEKNDVACVYSTDGVRLRERIEGNEQTLLAWHKRLHPLEFKEVRVGIYVNENIVRCIFGNTYLLRTHRGTPGNGTIAFQAWDRRPYHSALRVHSLEVRTVDPLPYALPPNP